MGLEEEKRRAQPLLAKISQTGQISIEGFIEAATSMTPNQNIRYCVEKIRKVLPAWNVQKLELQCALTAIFQRCRWFRRSTQAKILGLE